MPVKLAEVFPPDTPVKAKWHTLGWPEINRLMAGWVVERGGYATDANYSKWDDCHYAEDWLSDREAVAYAQQLSGNFYKVRSGYRAEWVNAQVVRAGTYERCRAMLMVMGLVED